MFAALNYKVVDLNRIKIGDISLDGIELGQYRNMTDKEINYLKNL